MSELKPGCFVTWRQAPHSLGITGCKVVSVGHQDQNGKPAALIEIGQFATDGKPVGALVEHLTVEA